MSTGRRYTISCQGLPPSPNRSMHHMERHRLWNGFKTELSWKARVAVTNGGGHPPFERAQVTITLHHRSVRHLFDLDNAHFVAKPALDALKGIMIADDSPRHIELRVTQDATGERGLTIEVTELLDEQAPVPPTRGACEV